MPPVPAVAGTCQLREIVFMVTSRTASPVGASGATAGPGPVQVGDGAGSVETNAGTDPPEGVPGPGVVVGVGPPVRAPDPATIPSDVDGRSLPVPPARHTNATTRRTARTLAATMASSANRPERSRAGASGSRIGAESAFCAVAS